MPVRVVSYGWDKYDGRVDASIPYTWATAPVRAIMIAAGHAVPCDCMGQKPV